MKTFRYKDYRTFRVGISVEGNQIGDEGDLSLTLCIADDADDMPKKQAEVRDESRQESNKNAIYWVSSSAPEIDELTAQLHASRKMVEKYDQLRAQNKITSEEATCLQDEKNSALNYQSRLRDKTSEAMEKGCGLFRGVARDAPSLGKSLSEIIRKLLGHVVPDLYPKLEMGSRPLKGNEAEEILKAVDLKALPQVFYSGEKGLSVVVKDGPKFVPNPNADVTKEVLDYLVNEHSYGNKDTRLGKALERRFGGIGYGWDRDMLRLILAVLFRAGTIEVSHGGQKFDSYQNPQCRTPFTNNTAFRSALFTPVKPPDLKTLTRAVESYESLTGETVDVEKNAIAHALKKFVTEELKQVLPIEAQVQAHRLPVGGMIQGFRESLANIETGSAEECVNILAGEGASLKEDHARIRKVGECLDGKGIATIRLARRAVGDMWPQIESRGQSDLSERVEELNGLLGAEDFFESMAKIGETAGEVSSAYQDLYGECHTGRSEQFAAAIEKIKGCPEWEAVPENMREPVLGPLASRCCTEGELLEGTMVCKACKATLSQMESDHAALGGLFAEAIAQIQKLTTPADVKIERVRVAEFFTGAIESEDQIKQSVARLQDHLLKLLDEGVKIVLE